MGNVVREVNNELFEFVAKYVYETYQYLVSMEEVLEYVRLVMVELAEKKIKVVKQGEVIDMVSKLIINDTKKLVSDTEFEPSKKKFNNNVVSDLADNTTNNSQVTADEITLGNNTIKIADDVVAVIAGVAVSEIPGVANMAGGFAGGITEVLSGKKNLAKGIKVDVGEKETKIDVNIIVEYGTRIPDVAYEIQTKVKKAVETMTGLKVIEVNVHVQGVNINNNNNEELKNIEQ